ncbi:MAG: hypothetical protein LBS50_11015 [Prevotellaceae bacterium]|jgi:hypothetical protein|nr:hypothetical protein [Prevotellaceae bacterium]
MTKRRKKRTGKSQSGFLGGITNSKSQGLGALATKAACVIGGVIIGSQIKKLIENKNVAGEDLLGLSGETSKYTSAAIITAAGVAGAMLVKNKLVRDAAIGTVAVGAVSFLNTATGKNIVALGDPENGEPYVLPAVAGTMIPGIGAVAIDEPINGDNLYGDNLYGDVYTQSGYIPTQSPYDASADPYSFQQPAQGVGAGEELYGDDDDLAGDEDNLYGPASLYGI